MNVHIEKSKSAKDDNPDITVRARFWARVNKEGPTPAHCPELGPCWAWTGAAGTGRKMPYGLIYIGGTTRGGYPTKGYAHRLSWELHNGPIPAGLFVCHHCDNPLCVNPDHLFVGTAKDNARDMTAKGRHGMQGRKGALSPRWTGGNHRTGGSGGSGKKLHSHIAMLIKHRHAQGGVTLKALGLEYGVSVSMVSLIVNGKRWPEVAA